MYIYVIAECFIVEFRFLNVFAGVKLINLPFALYTSLNSANEEKHTVSL